MGDLSANFSRYEFKCKCGQCNCDVADVKLIELLEKLRSEFGNGKITITSGHRCEEYNEKVGGSPESMHRLGKAADIIVEGVYPDLVYEFLDKKYPVSHGIGDYEDFTHIDVRAEKARW